MRRLKRSILSSPSSRRMDRKGEEICGEVDEKKEEESRLSPPAAAISRNAKGSYDDDDRDNGKGDTEKDVGEPIESNGPHTKQSPAKSEDSTKDDPESKSSDKLVNGAAISENETENIAPRPASLASEKAKLRDFDNKVIETETLNPRTPIVLDESDNSSDDESLTKSGLTTKSDFAFTRKASPRRTRSGGSSSTTNSRVGKKQTKSSPVELGEAMMERFIEEAEYEMNVDAYRGFGCKTVVNDAENNGPKLTSPWLKCQAGSFVTAKDQNERLEDGLGEVQMVCGSSCPCLSRWTADRNVMAAKKNRKAVLPAFGQRPEAPVSDESNRHQRFECDYNPYCLVSLGGVVTDILSDTHQSLLGGDDNGEKESDNDDVVEVPGSDESKKSDWELDPTKGDSIYDPETAHALKTIRRSIRVTTDRVKSHLRKIFQKLTYVSIDDCIDNLRRQHGQLIFSNPLQCDDFDSLELKVPSTNGKRKSDNEQIMLLSLPPGIKNLGATCYLNTQLQCLAQNLVLLEGIFSWTPSEDKSDDRMESVLRIFQRLLAEMKLGAKCTLNTQDFSDALGLDHFEQQDPNEFSRLLFERIHESFQAGASVGDRYNTTGSGKKNLSLLLPSLFEGVMAYETTCLSCNAKTTRSEKFMDLNLPIVRKQKKSAMRNTLDSFLGFEDSIPSVQDCLDEYCSKELLENENQYFCSDCEEKRDARREPVFRRLPPILNVQLSRYVFDRKTYRKVKLSDEVLLPISLGLKTSEEGVEINHRYLLCAVMRHQGTSAYSGHYIAEAKDWLTGQWFEFNDEQVKPLDAGPSCSFDPTDDNVSSLEASKSPKKKKAKVQGSKDAYNMYYVKEEFLAQSVIDGLKDCTWFDDGLKPASEIVSEDPGVVRDVSLQRISIYDDVARMITADGNVATRLQRRRKSLRERVLSDDSSIALGKTSETFWVDGASLRSFISCNRKSIEDPSLHYRNYLCSHERPGIHPRLSRRGKLLSNQVYRSILGVAETEFGPSDGTRYGSADVNASALCCDQCVDEYRRELGPKVDKIKQIMKLYREFDSKKEEKGIKTGDRDDPEDPIEFLISRRFATGFRKRVMNQLKRISSVDAGLFSPKSDAKSEGYLAECILEGIDAMSTDELDGIFTHGDDPVDALVNTNIICDHGRFDVHTKQKYICCDHRTWALVKKLFPNAIELNRQVVDDSSRPLMLECQDCVTETTAKEDQYMRLFYLAISCRHPNNFVSLSLSETESPQPIAYRLIHTRDLYSWRQFLQKLRRSGDKKMAIDAETYVKKTLGFGLPTATLSLEDAQKNGMTPLDKDRGKLLLSLLRPTRCRCHSTVVHAAFFKSSLDKEDNPLLHKHVEMLREDVYEDYLRYLAAIAILLRPGSDGLKLPEEINKILSAATELLNKVVGDSLHPQVFLCREGDASDTSSTRFSVGENHQMYVKSSLCVERECGDEFLQRSDPLNGDAADDNGSVTKKMGLNSSSPIVLDSDDEINFDDEAIRFRCFELEAAADITKSMDNIVQCTGLPLAATDVNDLYRRRSQRKRKTRYPMGAVIGDDSIELKPYYNIAAVRLMLMEQCQSSSSFQLNHRLALVVVPKPLTEAIVIDGETTNKDDSMQTPKVVELPFGLNTQCLREIFESALREKVEKHSKIRERVFLVRQALSCPSSVDVSDDDILDHLISISNLDTSKTTNVTSSPRSTRRVEKGFGGTFLSKGTSTSGTNGGRSVASNSLTPPTDQPTKKSKIDDVDSAAAPKKRIEDTSACYKDGTNADNAKMIEEYSPLTKRVKTDGSFSSEEEVTSTPPPTNDRSRNIVKSKEKLKEMERTFFHELSDSSPDKSRSDSPRKSAITSDSKRDLSSLKNAADLPTNTDRSELVMKVTGRLLNNDMVHAEHQSECLDVARKAVEADPNEDDLDTLVDSAFARYLQDHLSG